MIDVEMEDFLQEKFSLEKENIGHKASNRPIKNASSPALVPFERVNSIMESNPRPCPIVAGDFVARPAPANPVAIARSADLVDTDLVAVARSAATRPAIARPAAARPAAACPAASSSTTVDPVDAGFVAADPIAATEPANFDENRQGNILIHN